MIFHVDMSKSAMIHREALPKQGLNLLQGWDVVSYEQYFVHIQNEKSNYTPTGFDIYTGLILASQETKGSCVHNQYGRYHFFFCGLDIR
uniref:Uncharacterized protein n=1 Tax=Lactuca sativa TaxID=4236 RepID=A0A9R1VMS1_LACSA|nr:hypothetical protein LSAT_V11C500290520 [Lactuca sativa]